MLKAKDNIVVWVKRAGSIPKHLHYCHRAEVYRYFTVSEVKKYKVIADEGEFEFRTKYFIFRPYKDTEGT